MNFAKLICHLLGFVTAFSATLASAESTAIPQARNTLETSSTHTSDFEKYRLVLERNIFDPDRKPGTTEQTSESRNEQQSETKSSTEYLDLLGTFVVRGNTVAFLSGSPVPATTTATLGTTISAGRVTRIDSASVELASEDRTLSWPVGQRIERQSSGEWKLSGVIRSLNVQSDDATTSSSGRERVGGNATENEIIRKMMERRAKERKS